MINRKLDVTSKNDLRVLRLKSLYENMILEHTGKIANFNLDKSTVVGRSNYDKFLWVVNKCSELKISCSDYLTVLFQSPNSKPSWKYPYLQFIASDAGVEIYKYRRAVIERSFSGKNTDISKLSPVNFEDRFVNCYLGGARLIKGLPLVEQERLKESIVDLFSLFIAFPDVFSPEFVATHSLLEEFLSLEGGSDVKELQSSVFMYIGNVYKRLREDGVYFNRVKKAKEVTIAYEKPLVDSLLGDCEQIWKLLI